MKALFWFVAILVVLVIGFVGYVMHSLSAVWKETVVFNYQIQGKHIEVLIIEPGIFGEDKLLLNINGERVSMISYYQEALQNISINNEYISIATKDTTVNHKFSE